MKKSFKLGVPAATLVVAATLGAATLGAMTASPAQAGEYCRTDVTGHMTGCGFDTMEQCHAAASGIGGDCFRDPKLPGGPGYIGNRNSLASQPSASNSNALAYPPGDSHPARRGRHGHVASPE